MEPRAAVRLFWGRSEAGGPFVHGTHVTAELHLELKEEKIPEEADCTSFIFN